MKKTEWVQQLSNYKYALPFIAKWQAEIHAHDPYWHEYEAALNLYLISQNKNCLLAKRFSSLCESREYFQRLLSEGDNHIATRLALIRIHIELDDNQSADDEIKQLFSTFPEIKKPLAEKLNFPKDRPFLSPSRSYDSRSVDKDLDFWISEAVHDAVNHVHTKKTFLNKSEDHPNQITNNLYQDQLLFQDKNAHLEMRGDTKKSTIIIDGVFFQLFNTGIARVWQLLLDQWAKDDFSQNILILNRMNTVPFFKGLRYRSMIPYSYHDTQKDSEELQKICDEEGADLFISTYYTKPIHTPSVFMGYDMIPEQLKFNLDEPMWREKHAGIEHASAYIAISKNTANDLSRFCGIPLESIVVAHCGVDSDVFNPANKKEIAFFKNKYKIKKPYFLLSGGLLGYKNTILFFEAFKRFYDARKFDIVATGAGSQLPSEWSDYIGQSRFYSLQLTDQELRLAYAGAVALIYPSKYEGFGMPIIEAMACGCPVITTANGSLPEVAGAAAIYVRDNAVNQMVTALQDIQSPKTRKLLIEAGIQQAKKFEWKAMAATIKNTLLSISRQNKHQNQNHAVSCSKQKSDEVFRLSTPVIFLIFNRPDTTSKVFQAIRCMQPIKLLVIADGARANRPEELNQCNEAREIATQVDWDCELLTNFSDANLGCRRRVSSGLNWAFSLVDEAIILEDDCLPDPSFFHFCQELLEKYRDEESVMAISGDNFQFGRHITQNSYYFSRYPHIWGWATWKRAWQHYDLDMLDWPAMKNANWLATIFDDSTAIHFWDHIFQLSYEGFDTWDYAWVFACWKNNGLIVLPTVNLISNIGFDERATHTKAISSTSNIPREQILFPLRHPDKIVRTIDADNFTEKNQFSGSDFANRVSLSRSLLNKFHNKCIICGGHFSKFSDAVILNKYKVAYFQCDQCRFIQTEKPYWLKEAYSSVIASSDVGLVYRNINFSQVVGNIIFSFFDHNKKFLDFAGGYGLFVRLMRDLGFDFYWQDVYADNIFAHGFDISQNSNYKFEMVTAFEVFEHLENPIQTIEEIFKYSHNILFSTEIIPSWNPKPGDWWYYCTEEGQHISFYTLDSLREIAKKFNLNFYSNGSSLHLFTEKSFDLSVFQSVVSSKTVMFQKDSLLQSDYLKALEIKKAQHAQS